MRLSVYFIALICLCSCLPDRPAFDLGRRPAVNHPMNLDVGKEPSSKFVDAFGLKSSLTQFDKNSMKLHGKFFDDRISFYTVKDPGIEINDTEVASLTLYFIDSALMRKKYRMKSDISSGLIQTFGNFKFTPLHEAEKKALQAKDIIKRRQGKVFINERLANYQLKWVQEINTLSYVSSFNFSDSTSSYDLIQEVNYYRPYFRLIEQTY